MKDFTPRRIVIFLALTIGLICFSKNNTFANIDTVYASIPIGQIGSSCVDSNNFPNGISSISNYCSSSSGTNAIFTANNPSSGCVNYFGLNEGTSIGCFEICDPNQNCDTVIIFLNIDPATPLNVLCDTIIQPNEITISVSDCTNDAAVCLPIEFQVLNTLDIFDDGMLYTGSVEGCNMDTTVAYSYGSLIGQGTLGPYFLESWTINGTEYSGDFADINALLDSMNIWDSLGVWEFDTIVPNTISGGFNDNVYGPIVASKPGVNNSTVSMGANFGLTPLGGQILLPIGSHEVSVLDNNNSCSDTVTINIACLPNDYLSLETYTNVSGSICVDTSDLIGNFATLENSCENSGVTVDIFPDDICVDWETQEAGNYQLCLVACDDLGFCDTTFISYTIYAPQTDTIEVILEENDSEYICVDSTELIGEINDFSILTPPTLTSLVIDSVDYCLEINSTTAGTEFACVILCDNQGGCDTTCFSIIVNDPSLGAPIANDDADTTDIDLALMLDFLANDITTPTDTINIITAPQNGILSVDSLGNYVYLPDPGVCGFDEFTYEICNTFGCDQAVVALNVLCDEVQVYNGFSPNGDGVNETFMITGLESFPDHRVSVFNRWGNLVFESENYKSNWDGTWNGNQLMQGSYFFVVELNNESNTRYSGSVYIAY